MEHYLFKGWDIQIISYHDQLGNNYYDGFAIKEKYLKYYDYEDAKHGMDCVFDDDDDFDYILIDDFSESYNRLVGIDVNSTSSILDRIVTEILDKEIEPKTDFERWLRSRGQRWNDKTYIILKEVQKRKTKQTKNKRGTLHRAWALMVKNRDKICVECKSDNDLHAHHIKQFKNNEELRYDVNNGITLCSSCHKKHHKENGR